MLSTAATAVVVTRAILGGLHHAYGRAAWSMHLCRPTCALRRARSEADGRSAG